MGLDLSPSQWLAWFSADLEERAAYRAEVRGSLRRQLADQPGGFEGTSDHAVVSDRGVVIERVWADRTETLVESSRPNR